MISVESLLPSVNASIIRCKSSREMMERSGIKQILWSLFVDTDSLYLHTRQRFGVSARMDYLQLPANIIQRARDIEFFQDKVALTMRLGKDWGAFSESLQRFGYDTIPADRGMQPMTIATKVMALMGTCNGIVIVTSSNKVLPLVHQIVEIGGFIKLVSFSEELLSDLQEVDEAQLGVILMDEGWLWNRRGI